MGNGRENSAVLKSKEESYKHASAKLILKEWLSNDFEARSEVKFDNDGWRFISDVVTYTDGHIQAFYEVVHRHPVDAKKLSRLQYYCMMNHLDILCHEVDAEWILLQVDKPDRLVEFTYDLSAKLFQDEYE